MRETEEPSAGASVRRSLLFMTLLAIFTGVIGGVGAWLFRMLIGFVHNTLFLRHFSFSYDANVHTPAGPWDSGVIFVPLVGAILVAWLVKNFAPEAKGHGVPEVMDAIYYNRGVIRPRVALVKSLASAISIGSGGSVGREGPIIQIGSAFGSTLGQVIRMHTRDRVILIAAGAGAGIAATFNAPLGGAVFAIELLLVSVNARSLLLVATATATATYVSHLLLGTQPSFFIPELEFPSFHLMQPWSLLLFFPLGILMGLVSVSFIRGIYWMEDVFEALPGNYYTRHALGMLCVGVMIYLMQRYAGHYYIQGVGYATIMDILRGVLADPLFLLLLLGLKLLATCLSLGSGASGGVFSPALFMGATAGAAFGYLCNAFAPELHIDIATFAIAGMAAAIAGSTGALVTGIVMISEMTQDYAVALPLIVTASVAYAVRKSIMKESIYTMKLLNRGHTVPEGLEAPFLSIRKARDLVSTDFVRMPPDAPADGDYSVVVVESKGRIVGVMKRSRMRDSQGMEIPPHTPARNYLTVGEDTSLLSLMNAMETSDADVVLVSSTPELDRAASLVGVITGAQIAQILKQQEDLI